MQSLKRTKTMVQGFDVSIANKEDIVLFVVNEAANDQALYLTSGRRRVAESGTGAGGSWRGSAD